MIFNDIARDITERMKRADVVAGTRWQSIKAPQPMLEILNYSFTYELPTESLDFYREQIKPNLPWADRHFIEERVSGDPINPGHTWRIWPYSASADTHRREGEEDPQFDHSYAERYWPKAANTTKGGVLHSDGYTPHSGVRFLYGDLDDLVTILSREPTTRQAYLPVWFPEDLQACVEEKRVPCSLGYHFIMRRNQLHCVYYLRSCDFIRHWRDDVYLTLRLQLWVLDQCRLACPEMDWDKITPGTLTMHITSLHCFETDRIALK